MVFQHHESCDGLCDQEFHEKGYGEVARPFVEEAGDRFHAHMLASYPCADDGQADREEEHGTQDVDGHCRAEAVTVVGDLSCEPFGGLVGHEYESNDGQPYEGQYGEDVRPHTETESTLKTGDQWSDDHDGDDRDGCDKQCEFSLAAWEFHVKVH